MSIGVGRVFVGGKGSVLDICYYYLSQFLPIKIDFFSKIPEIKLLKLIRVWTSTMHDFLKKFPKVVLRYCNLKFVRV